MTLCTWAEMPSVWQDSLRSSDSAVLGPICNWMHRQVEGRRNENEDADLAQSVCGEMLRMMGTPAGKRTLLNLTNVASFLEVVARRLKRGNLRSRGRYEAMLGRFMPVHQSVPDAPALVEHEELLAAIGGAMTKLPRIGRTVLKAYVGGLCSRRIAEDLSSASAKRFSTNRVKTIIHRTRRDLRQMLAPVL